MSYSQFGEDKIVAEIFGAAFVGTLLEIGAWSPTHLSNSRLLIEAGWSATLVEFSPNPVHALLLAYGYEERVRIIQAAITAGEEHVSQFEITENALSSNSPVHNKVWKDASVAYYGHLWVPTLSVRRLLDQFFGDTRFDFASVDTEGSSVEIAEAIIESDWRPKVICVEYDNLLVRLQQSAQKHGYRAVHTNGCNVILERK